MDTLKSDKIVTPTFQFELDDSSPIKSKEYIKRNKTTDPRFGKEKRLAKILELKAYLQNGKEHSQLPNQVQGLFFNSSSEWVIINCVYYKCNSIPSRQWTCRYRYLMEETAIKSLGGIQDVLKRSVE